MNKRTVWRTFYMAYSLYKLNIVSFKAMSSIQQPELIDKLDNRL